MNWFPVCLYFQPAEPFLPQGELTLTLDELGALRLADFEGLYQEDAAKQIGVSRSTFARILGAARRKVVEALIMGKIVRIQGGMVAHEAEKVLNNR